VENRLSRLKDFLLPVRGAAYSVVPWGWVICLILIELILSIILGVIMSVFGINAGSAIGVVNAMSGSMTFAMYAEQRSLGVLTKTLKRQLALRSAFLVSVLGTSLTAPAFLGETEGVASQYTALIIAGVFVATFLLNWVVHLIGLNQGQRLVGKQAALAAKRAGFKSE
jgi:hypothetical protein